METQKYPKGMIVLIIIFVFSILKGISQLSSNSLDFRLLDQYSFGWLHYIVVTILILFSVLLVYAFWKRKAFGYKLAFFFFGINIVYTFIGFILSVSNKELIVQNIIQKRLERGLPIEGIGIETLNSGLFFASFIGYLVFYLFLSWYVYKKRRYFSFEKNEEIVESSK